MESPLLKTLEATLVEPTAHKERKLDSLLETYRAALRDAFEANCASMSATNEIVTGYDLPYQAKDALKRYVPQIAGANDIHEDHPVRLVNRAAKFDRDCSREFEFCWNVPQPGRGTNFWIPLRINPEQHDLWNAVLERDAAPGELRLTKHEERWAIHVTVERTIDVPSIQSRRTPIGIDIGESQLVTGCALKDGNPERPLIISGSQSRRLRKQMYTTLKRLQKREASTW